MIRGGRSLRTFLEPQSSELPAPLVPRSTSRFYQILFLFGSQCRPLRFVQGSTRNEWLLYQVVPSRPHWFLFRCLGFSGGFHFTHERLTFSSGFAAQFQPAQRVPSKKTPGLIWSASESHSNRSLNEVAGASPSSVFRLNGLGFCGRCSNAPIFRSRPPQ